jgi:predicted MFS family arabinose efflux permease
MLSRGLTRLLALTCGVTVANIYYAQPMLHTITRSLGASQSAGGYVVATTQFGFAAGLLFVVPLGDILARRPLLTAMLGVDAVALAACAAAPSLQVLGGLAALVGLSSVAVQMLIPYAATLAQPEERARTIGALMGGLLLGVLLSRTFAGVVASAVGWRGVYAIVAGVMVVMTFVLNRVLPPGGREVGIGYGAQMRGVLRLALSQPVLRWRAVIGAAQFGAFSCFWTTITFLLSGRAYQYTQAQIGLFALVGVAGASCALGVGRVLDRRKDLRWAITGFGIAAMGLSFGVLALGTRGLAWLIVGALLMDGCSQVVHVSNQSVIYDLVDSARSRITSTYMTVYFLGGALGTTLGTAAYDRVGWVGACAAAAAFCGVGALAWLASHRHERPAVTATRTGPLDGRQLARIDHQDPQKP